MPDWFDQHQDILAGMGGSAYMPYEAGGVAGPRVGPQVQPQNFEMPGLVANAGAPGGSAVMPSSAGFDPTQQVGHEGTIGGLNREQYANAWMSSGVKSVAEMQDWLRAHGGTMVAANGTVLTPFGETLDMGGNAKGSMAGRGNLIPAWGGGGGGPAPAGGPGGGFAGGGGGFAGGFGGGGGPNINIGSFSASPLTAAQQYTPTAITGPDRLDIAQIARPNDVTVPDALRAQILEQQGAFKAPTAEEAAADQGYQFALKQGQGALSNKFAASGLRGAGQAQALTDYNQNAAAQQYGNVYNRRFGEYQNAFQQALAGTQANNQAQAQAYGLTNQYRQGAEQFNAQMGFNTQAQNIQNQIQAYNAYQPLAQQSQQFNEAQRAQAFQNYQQNRYAVEQANAQNALGAFQANTTAQLGAGNLALGYGNLGLGYYNADINRELGMGNLAVSQGQLGLAQSGQAFNQGLQTFNTNYGVYRDNRDTAFNQALALGQLGAGVAGNYGNAASGLITGAGNAAAAGQVGAGNAYNQAFGGIANTALGAAGMYAGYGGFARPQGTPYSGVPYSPYGYG